MLKKSRKRTSITYTLYDNIEEKNIKSIINDSLDQNIKTIKIDCKLIKEINVNILSTIAKLYLHFIKKHLNVTFIRRSKELKQYMENIKLV